MKLRADPPRREGRAVLRVRHCPKKPSHKTVKWLPSPSSNWRTILVGPAMVVRKIRREKLPPVKVVERVPPPSINRQALLE